MASVNGGLSERLLREPYTFDFFQAVRVLQPPGSGASGRKSTPPSLGRGSG